MKLLAVGEQLDITSKIIKISLQLGAGIGALIIIIYTAKVGYYPSGLTIGDGLLFIAVALSFGLCYSMVVFMLYSTAFALTPVWRAFHIREILLKLQAHTRIARRFEYPPLTSEHIPAALMGLIGMILIILSYFESPEIFTGLIISVGWMALFFPFLTSIKSDENDSVEVQKLKQKERIIMAASLYIIPLIVGGFHANVLDASMSLVGIRSGSATVQFQKDYAEFVALTFKDDGRKTYEAKVLFNGPNSYTKCDKFIK